jgi:hypothetical protein
MASLGAAVPGAAQGQPADEYQVKAAYMYNFAKFVDWQPQTFESATQPIAFCVLGQSPLSQPLQEALNGKVVGQRPLVFRQITEAKQAGKCQVVFLGASDRKQLRQALDELKTHNTLTVGEVEGFTNEGGIIRFVLDMSRIRLEFNLDAADDAKLHISAKLLSLGKTIRKAAK